MDNFKLATKENVRFKTNVGQLSTEQLWSASDNDLEQLAQSLDEQLSKVGTKTYFTKKSSEDKLLKLKYDVVIDIINTKIEEREAASTAKNNKVYNQKILEKIAAKEDKDLDNKSVDELKAMLK